jgi:hypothetical protein
VGREIFWRTVGDVPARKDLDVVADVVLEVSCANTASPKSLMHAESFWSKRMLPYRYDNLESGF